MHRAKMCSQEMPGQLAALDQAYGGGDFLAGAKLSGADLFVAPILACLQFMPEGDQLMAKHPNVLRAQNLLRQCASFTSTIPQ
jgi:glutathione S-transferase